MEMAIVKTDFQGLINSIKKSKYPLTPIYEAITNSIEAICQNTRLNIKNNLININFYYTGLLEEIGELDYIEITDHGIGFNIQNYERFKTLLDKSKGFNNRGSGRIQFVHRFDDIKIISRYFEEGTLYKRTFSLNKDEFIYKEDRVKENSKKEPCTTIKLKAGRLLARDKDYYDNITINELVKDLKKHFLLRYHLNTETELPQINISFYKNKKKESNAVICKNNIPVPYKTGEITVSYLKLDKNEIEDIKWNKTSGKEELIKWAHFKLPEEELDHNGVYLCSKSTPIETVPYSLINKTEILNENHYVTVFFGDILDNDKYVNHSVDGFLFADKKEIEKEIRNGDGFYLDDEFLFDDTIKDEINKILPDIYSDILDLKEEKIVSIEEIARLNGISNEIVASASFNITDSKKVIIEKLYVAQAKSISKNNQKIRQVFDELNELNPIDDNYQDELERKGFELLELIPQTNKEELGRYVIRREMVANILHKILNQELKYQNTPKVKGKNKKPEKLVHDLIFKSKSKDTKVLNDLWILDEEFVHFEGCSELPLNKIKFSTGENLLKKIPPNDLKVFGIKPRKTPDIFLYPEEGKCILIELKEPSVDLSDHLQQLPKYCNIIANYSNKPITKFYCYLIGEVINPHIDLNEFNKMVSGSWVKPETKVNSVLTGDKIATVQLEVVKLSSLSERAHRRNRSFAEKLGLPDLLGAETELKD